MFKLYVSMTESLASFYKGVFSEVRVANLLVNLNLKQQKALGNTKLNHFFVRVYSP